MPPAGKGGDPLCNPRWRAGVVPWQRTRRRCSMCNRRVEGKLCFPSTLPDVLARFLLKGLTKKFLYPTHRRNLSPRTRFAPPMRGSGGNHSPRPPEVKKGQLTSSSLHLFTLFCGTMRLLLPGTVGRAGPEPVDPILPGPDPRLPDKCDARRPRQNAGGSAGWPTA